MWSGNLAAMKRRCRETFPTMATLAPKAGGGPYSFRAIFDDAYQMQEVVEGAAVTTTRPVLDVLEADLPVVPAVGDSVVVASVQYRIVDVQPDGGGMTLCVLNRTT